MHIVMTSRYIPAKPMEKDNTKNVGKNTKHIVCFVKCYFIDGILESYFNKCLHAIQ